MSPYYINNDILLFLEKSLRETVISFLPKKEIILLPPDYSQVNTSEVFYDYIFAIEKLLNTHVIPGQYSPKYSTKIITLFGDDTIKEVINKKIKYFKVGDSKINDKSSNVLPKSSYRYFNDVFHGKKKRYEIDYVCDAYGIRHCHLYAQNDDHLLFYVLANKDILLLNTGNHKSIYENNNLRILINEFPEYLNILGIQELSGIDPGIEESGELQKLAWEKNVSNLASIDGKTYSPSMASFKTFSGVNLAVQNIFQNIIYQINNAITEITNSLGKKHNLFVKKAKSKLALKNGIIFIGDRITNKEWSIYIPYFKKFGLIEMIISSH